MPSLNLFHAMKKNPELVPLFATVGVGLTMALGYMGHQMTNGYHLAWSRHSYPWLNAPMDKNQKFLGLQAHKHEDVFKPQAADDMRGKI